MPILITGANGQLGRALQETLSHEALILKDLPDFDLTDSTCEKEIMAANPDVILHVAAYTDVDGAEREASLANAVNVRGTTYVARAAQALGARLMYVSTDYVFDGEKNSPYTEKDTPRPLNQYGLSKYKGEQAALTLCENTLVVRTAWLYGYAGKNFVTTIMRLATETLPLEVVDDQRGCPTYADDLAKAIRQLLTGRMQGICHVTNSGHCTWQEFAQAIVQQMGLEIVVRPITTAQAGRPATRPAYSVLSQERFASQYSPLPDWRDALARFMKRVPYPVRASG